MLPSFADLLSVWRTTVVRDREIVDAVVRPEHLGPSPALRRLLETWPGPYYWATGEGPGRLVLIRALTRGPRERWWLHLVLFALTFGTVAMGGTLLAGARPLVELPVTPDLATVIRGGWRSLQSLAPGVPFAMALLGILLAHEFGHYATARRYAINASPPYFLPAPPFWVFLGTLGAFIRLRSPVVDRRQLMDVGAAGPWTGLIVALVLLIVGLSRSTAVQGLEGYSAQIMLVGEAPVYLGDSPLTWLLRRLFFGQGTVVLHPLALAGWLGVFVTMLNLLPFGQLDGGHILYALIGRHQRVFGVAIWLALVVLGFEFRGWWIWAFLVLLLGRGRLSHPSVLDRHRPLPTGRRWLGWATIAVFLLTFTPIPFHA